MVADLWIEEDGLIHLHELWQQALSLGDTLNHDPMSQVVPHIYGAGYQLFPSF